MHEYNQTVTQGCLWPNMIRDSNDDGWSAQFQETEISLWAAGEQIWKQYGKYRKVRHTCRQKDFAVFSSFSINPSKEENQLCLKVRAPLKVPVRVWTSAASQLGEGGCVASHNFCNFPKAINPTIQAHFKIGQVCIGEKISNKLLVCATECNTINAFQEKLSESVPTFKHVFSPCLQAWQFETALKTLVFQHNNERAWGWRACGLLMRF